MENIFKRTQGWRWFPDADQANAPEGSLLRADNTIPDRVGARTLRFGTNPLYSGLAHQRVHSLYTPTLQSTVFRLAGIDDRVYRNGEDFGESFSGSGDIAFVDDSYQAFMARSKTKKKFDGTNFHNWGIAAPEFPATAIAANALVLEVASFDSLETPAFVANEGTTAFVNNYAGTANAAMSLQPNATTGRGSVSKKFLADTNFNDIFGSTGGSTDLFDMRVWLEDPRKVDKVTIMFGLGAGDDPFVDDYYYFNFNIRNDGTADVKDTAAQAYAAYTASTSKLLSALTTAEITSLKSPEEAGAVLKRLGGNFTGPQTRERPDAQQNSPAWGHFSVTRGQFIRVGHTAGRDWRTVRGFKIVYTAVPGSIEKIQMDDASWTGGGDRALTGTFQVGYRFARRLLDINGNEVYTELSPMSPISSPIVLKQQTMQVTIPAASVSGADPQVDTIWVYLNGGWLDTFYRFAVLPSDGSLMTIDEISSPGKDFAGDSGDRVRLTSHGFSYAPGSGSGSSDLIFTVIKSELDALVENEIFEAGAVNPPENIIALAGPQNKRVFALTSEGWVYPSTIKSPACFSLYHTIDCRMYGTPYWIVKTGAGIYAGFSKDIIRIAGSGAENENHIIADLFAVPMSVANPPVDSMVTVDGNSIIYRAADGPMLFNGSSSSPVPFVGTSLLWRGENRHGVLPLNRTTGRFRVATDDHNLFMLVPEGDATDPGATWKLQSEPESQWCRFVYPTPYISIYKEPDGSLLAGTANGAIHEIEIGSKDGSSDIAVDILTPISEGNNPLARKDSVDFQFHGITGGNNATVSFYKDGDQSEFLSKIINLPVRGIYRNALRDLREFVKIQLRVSGNFNSFVMAAVNLQVTTRPQHVMVLDLAEMVPSSGSDIGWATQIEIDCNSGSDLSLEIYKNDVLHATLPVPVTPNVRDVYTVVTPRKTHARRLGFILKTTAADASGQVGFECYSFKVRHGITGNMTELMIGTGDSGSA